MFAVDHRDPTPLHAQLERAIRTAVAAGLVRAGDQLPTVRQLAVELKVNANTVARVYSTLEREGLLATQRGVGTFIRAPAPHSADGKRLLERELRALSARFIADAAALGFSAAATIDHLQRTYGKE